MTSRERLSATVEPELLEAARAAVAEGRAASVSDWVNDALRAKVEHDRRMAALDEFLAAYESEHGEITEQEIRDATRRTRARAVVVRTPPRKPRARGRKRGAAGASFSTRARWSRWSAAIATSSRSSNGSGETVGLR